LTFTSLFWEGQQLNPLDCGQFARSKAEEVLTRSGIGFSEPRHQFSLRNGALIGIAFYSRDDLEFLDRIVAARGETASNVKEIIVFDVLGCKTMDDFEKLIPGIGLVYQTPVVGIWRDGELVEKGVGAKGRMLLKSASPKVV
jgi:hypothetical protein